MKIDFNRLDDLNAKVALVIEHADYGPKLEESLKNYSKKVAMKGFRAGKTPKSVLIKMYGKGLLEESVMNLVNEKLFAYLDEQKIGIFGSPMVSEGADPVDFDPKSKEDYKFQFDLGLKPDFELDFQFDTPIDISVPTVDQSAIEEDIIRYRRVFGEDTPVTDGAVEAYDKVSLHLLPAGAAKDAEAIESVIDLERTPGEPSDVLKGKKVGDHLEADLEKLLGLQRSMIVKNTLQLEEDPNPDNPLAYQLSITAINRPQTTPLTGEQITRLTGQEMKDESEFKAFLENRATDELKSQAADMKKMAVRLRLTELHPFEIPEDFLFKWVNHQREKKIEEGSREATQLFRDARWSLLLNRIAEADKLEVTDKDVQSQVTQWIVQNVNYMQTDIRKLMDELYANEYFMSSMKENALEEVIFRHILEKYTFTEKEVTAEEFEKIFHDLHHQVFDHGDHHHENSGEESEHSHA